MGLILLAACVTCHPVRYYDIGHVLDDVVPDRMWWARPVQIWVPYVPAVREHAP